MGTFLNPSGMGAAAQRLRIGSRYRRMIGVGGVGTGLFLHLSGDHTLGRNESRAARLVDARDYCKLHIICHYVAALLGSDPEGAGFHVVPVAKVGDDETGRGLISELSRGGIDVSHVGRVAGLPTLFSVCFQYGDGSGGNITITGSAAAALAAADVDACEPLLERQGGRTIVLAVPEAPLEVRDHLLRLGGEYGALRVASFTSGELGGATERGMLERVDLIALNQHEAETLVGSTLDPNRPERLLQHCAEILGAGARPVRVVVTAGKHGAFAMEADVWGYCGSHEVPVESTAGAGDALLAGVIAGTVAGMPFAPRGSGTGSALELGVLLATLSVTSPHTIHPGADMSAIFDLAGRLGLEKAELLRYTCNGPAEKDRIV